MHTHTPHTNVPPLLQVRAISAKKNEPEWMLEFRLKAFRRWLQMEEPRWSDNEYPAFDYQGISYYSEPKKPEKKQSLDEVCWVGVLLLVYHVPFDGSFQCQRQSPLPPQHAHPCMHASMQLHSRTRLRAHVHHHTTTQVDPELLRTFEKLGIPLNEQKRMSNVAVDAVFDSVSIATTFREDLAKHGVIFCSISEAAHKYPELVKKHMGSVVRFPCVCVSVHVRARVHACIRTAIPSVRPRSRRLELIQKLATWCVPSCLCLHGRLLLML